MNRIVLIGNGFDLAHGLKTSYKDFIDWYWEQWGNNLLHGPSKEVSDGLCSFKINDDINVPNWSCAFQGWYYRRDNTLIPWNVRDVINLVKGDKNFCKFSMSPFLQQICTSIDTKKWVDIENEYYDLLTKCVLEGNTPTTIEDLNAQLHTLQEKLIEYLCLVADMDIKPIAKIKNAIYSHFKKEDISIAGQQKLTEHIEGILQQDECEWYYKLSQYEHFYNSSEINRYKNDIVEGKNVKETEIPIELLLPNQIMFLNFNYTNTADKYILPQKSIFTINHIHGQINKPESVIFGYGDEIDDKYKELEKNKDNRCLNNIKSIRYLEADNYRKILSFIEAEPYQIIIFGHSCGNSDRTLLNTLFEHENCVSVKPYYHKKADGTDNYLELIQNISRNFTDMKLMRDRVVNKTYCETMV